MNKLGWRLLQGGGPRRQALAEKLFRMAADRGDSRAMINLGNRFEAREDYEYAYHWYKRAAEAGSAIGRFNVANLQHWGRFLDEDRAAAYQTFRDLYAFGFDKSCICFYMGLYAEMGYVQAPDLQEARRYYTEGALYGDALCCTNLGGLLSVCEEMKDEELAFSCYLRAAQLGDPLAYANVAYCYETGQGVPPDDHKAFEYYSRGAALGEEHCIEWMEA